MEIIPIRYKKVVKYVGKLFVLDTNVSSPITVCKLFVLRMVPRS